MLVAPRRAVSRLADCHYLRHGLALRQQPFFTISAIMNPTQCRMARAGLGWSLDQLEKKSCVSRRTVLRFETGERVKLETVETMRSALVAGGAMFVDVEGRPGVTIKGG